jgi:hypothetical protein
MIHPGEAAVLKNMYFEPNELGFLEVKFDFHSWQSGESYKYHVIQVHAGTHEIMGGTACQINIVDCNSIRTTTGKESISTDKKDTTKTSVIQNTNTIQSVHPNPATDEITVTCELHEVEKASLIVSSYYHRGISDNFILDVNTQRRNINISVYPIGVYIVTLICDGKMTDSKIFVKY